ncbi:MAG TPA: hypothetical protein VHF58_05400 [Solirubrobacterales bacterium]|nr:hypothetical protein [Solirubrobacterales bacterium]
MSPSVRTIVASTALAAVLAAAYLAWEPTSQDLAAAVFRAELFSEHGFLLWNDQWYSGHHLLSYSVTYPPLADLVGVRLSAALAVVAGAALFALIVSRRVEGARAFVPSLWFAAGLASWLLTGRMPFLVAVPFGLAAIAAAERDRNALAGVMAALASLASPVTGLFVGLVGVAIGLAGRRVRGAWLALGAGLPILGLNLAFPVGGEEPFVFSAFVAVPLAATAALWLVPREHAALRISVLLYALLTIAVFVIPNPLGGNVTRLGALLAGPVLALVLWPRGRLLVLAVSLPLAYWQLVAPVRDVIKGTGDPATERAFFEPLLGALDRVTAGDGTVRLHIPPTENRWEAAYVAPRFALARGWLRQLESDDFDLFADGELTAPLYEEWLAEHAVSYVAVPEAELDYLAEDEVDLIHEGLSYLDPVWSNERWRLYRVAGAGISASGIDGLAVDRIVLDRPEPGTRTLPVNWTRYWGVEAGTACVRESDDGRIELEVRGPGRVEIATRLGGDSCSE